MFSFRYILIQYFLQIGMGGWDQGCLTVLISGTKTWTRGDSSSSLTCSGEHEVSCDYTFKPKYDSDGDYTCKGYNKVRQEAIEQTEGSVTLITGL